MTTDPMKLLFDQLRQDIKKRKHQRDLLDRDIQALEQLEVHLMENHSDPKLRSVLRYVYEKRVGEEEKPIEEKEKERLGPAATVRLLFSTPHTTLTAGEVRDSLESMLQQGRIETTSTKFDSDRVNKILRSLRDQGFLKRVEVEKGDVLVKAYKRDIKE